MPSNKTKGAAGQETAVPRGVRRVIIAVVGGTVVLLGLAMVLLPGPGLLVALGGLAILGTEFLWARRLLRRSRAQIGRGTRWWNRWWKKARGGD